MKLRIWLCLFLILGLAIHVFASLEAGHQAMSQGRWVDAVLSFRAVLREDPKSNAGHAGLASAMYALARYEEVMTVFPNEIKNGNIDLNTRDQEAFTILKMIGFASFKNRYNMKAISALSLALKIQDDDPAIYNVLGWAYLGTDSFKLSEIAFRTAANLDPEKAEYQDNLGSAFLAQNLYREALLAFEKSVRLDRKYYPAWEHLWNTRTLIGLPSKRGSYDFGYFLTATEDEKAQAAANEQQIRENQRRIEEENRARQLEADRKERERLERERQEREKREERERQEREEQERQERERREQEERDRQANQVLTNLQENNETNQQSETDESVITDGETNQ